MFASNTPIIGIDIHGDSLAIVIWKGLSSQDPVLKDREFFVDSKIANNVVGFVNEAQGKFKSLSVNNIFRSQSSSSIKTSNTRAKGLSRHQGGFAIDFNGVRTLNDEQLQEFNTIAEKYGFKPLTNQKNDLPHFSVDPTNKGYNSLKEAVQENKSHFDAIQNGTAEPVKVDRVSDDDEINRVNNEK